jgi:hypothetical protein
MSDITRFTVTSIINHGSIIQLVGVDAEGFREAVSGDARPMSYALEALNVQVGDVVAYGYTEDGQVYLSDASEFDEDEGRDAPELDAQHNDARYDGEDYGDDDEREYDYDGEDFEEGRDY